MAEEIERRTVKEWWANRPMTYGREHGQAVYVADDGAEERVELGSPEFFNRVDETFYSWNAPLHAPDVPFGNLFPYATYRGHRVLEVGCGMGTMAMNWSRQGARITAVDLNPVAVAQTRHRFNLFSLPGTVLQTDGGSLPFANDRFDYVYSWGVLHHSPGLATAIGELFRVLRPGGGFGVMLYNRRSLRYGYLMRYVEGFLHGESRFLSPLHLTSRYSDGSTEEGNPHTWPVTPAEMATLFGRYTRRCEMTVIGYNEVDSVLRVMAPAVWRLIPDALMRALERRWGWSLWISGVKDQTA